MGRAESQPENRTIRRIYDAAFGCALVASSPYYFWKMWRRGNWREGFGERFGKYGRGIKQALTNRRVLWMHAVSVGEVNLCTQLIRLMELKAPNLKLVVSTTTSTGLQLLQKRLPSHVERIYYPIDRRRYVSRALSVINPEAVVLVEAEIWPNFLWELEARGVPVYLVNARLSERSFRGYRRFGFLFRPLFGGFAGVGAQNEDDKRRLVELGCRAEAIETVGNLKFDAAAIAETRRLDVPGMFRQLGVADGSRVLLGGSTHDGEEALLAGIFRRLKGRHPDLFLVLVPRHFERGKSVGEVLKAQGIKFRFRNEMTGSVSLGPGEVDCLLVNTTGELNSFYEHATVVFVGKSLTARGGQNPIEPGMLGKAMVFGPHMENFEKIAEEFVREGGAVRVADVEGLEAVCGRLLGDAGERERLGKNALAVVRRNQGGVERTVEMILRKLGE